MSNCPAQPPYMYPMYHPMPPYPRRSKRRQKCQELSSDDEDDNCSNQSMYPPMPMHHNMYPPMYHHMYPPMYPHMNPYAAPHFHHHPSFFHSTENTTPSAEEEIPTNHLHSGNVVRFDDPFGPPVYDAHLFNTENNGKPTEDECDSVPLDVNESLFHPPHHDEESMCDPHELEDSVPCHTHLEPCQEYCDVEEDSYKEKYILRLPKNSRCRPFVYK